MRRALAISLASGVLVVGLIALVGAHPDAPDATERSRGATQSYDCRRATGEIAIDGRGDEEAWRTAATIDGFALPWLRDQPRPAYTKTRARLLWDDDYLYFLAEMEDSDLYADVTEHDGRTWDNDVFELFFKPSREQPGYYELQVNAAGTVLDIFFPRRGSGGYQRYARDGEFHIEAKVARRGTLNNWRDRDTGWTVEGRIPWSDFERTGGRPAAGDAWSFALCRYDYSVAFEGPDLSTSAPLSSLKYPDFHHFEDYATLRFVGE
ncbi:MAG: carbohydrate-binding family 9-like protein [Planctomycetes bacterium]|nr:carbohydrate-binding family 9-like protein [Planctomycetota bacterium]